MEDNHGKEIKLVRTTVKIPGQRPRGSESSSSSAVHTSQLPNGHASKLLDSSKLFFRSSMSQFTTFILMAIFYVNLV